MSTSSFTLRNKHGTEVVLNAYGARIMSICVPDREGRVDDVVLGFPNIEAYIDAGENEPYFGCVVGRFGNRIARGEFSLENGSGGGETYTLAVNDGENHLHGGIKGFDKVIWGVVPKDGDGNGNGDDNGECDGGGDDAVAVATRNEITFVYLSEDGEEGYPGNLNVTVKYQLSEDNEVVINYHATTDKATPVNLTNHVYLNLAGEGTTDVLDHELTIHADKFTPVDPGLIPNGTLMDLADEPTLDFRQPKTIGRDINANTDQLTFAGGYDHNYALNKYDTEGGGRQTTLAATVWHPATGRFLEVETEEPGVQFYSGNFLDGKVLGGKSGRSYGARAGFCLETQHFPDSPNRVQFPSTVLQPGEEYRTKTVYRFSVKG